MELKIKVDDRQVMEALQALQRQSGDMAPALAEIGEDLTAMAHRAFDTETSPVTGFKWPERVTDTGRKILTGETGQLNDSINYRLLGQDGVEIGSPMEYAAIHQLGGKTKAHEIRPRNKKALAFGGLVVKSVNHPGSVIPARPFLPVGPNGELAPEAQRNILEILGDHLERAFRP